MLAAYGDLYDVLCRSKTRGRSQHQESQVN
jgi:hypothetical protein